MPTRLIEYQSNMFVRPEVMLLGKGTQSQLKGLHIDGGHQQPGSPTALWLHKAVQIHPLIALLHYSGDFAPFFAPHAAQDRFEPNAMLIATPQFHRGLPMGLTNQFDLLWQFF